MKEVSIWFERLESLRHINTGYLGHDNNDLLGVWLPVIEMATLVLDGPINSSKGPDHN